jgi:hypothetical protein
MAINARYVLVCDEVRQENNGKYLVIGLYTPDMAIPQIPFLLPSVTFVVALESDRPTNNLQIRFALQHLESGQDVAAGMGAIAFPKPGVGISPINLRNLQLPNAGTYVFSMNIEGRTDPITATFSVILVPPQQQGFPQMSLGR